MMRPRLLPLLFLLCAAVAPAAGRLEAPPREDPPAPRPEKERDLRRDVDLAQVRLRLGGARAERAELSLYTTTATWCAACKKEQPQVAYLRERFSEDEVALFGVPTDPADTDEKLDAYVAKYRPAYTLLRALAADDVLLLRRVIYKRLRVDGLPATVVVDRQGRVHSVTAGVPTLSEVRKLLHRGRKSSEHR